jgi:hypothetical protein
VLGSGTSLAQHVSDASHNGYLSSTDWSTFNSKSTVTPAALTKTDDTNVTLTLGGTPATSLLQAASVTAGWTGTLGVSRGGTGAATFAAHSYLGNNTGSTAAPAPHVIDYSELSGTPTIPTGGTAAKVYSTNLTIPATSSLVLADYIRMDAGAALTVPNGSSVFIEAPTQPVPANPVTVTKVTGHDFSGIIGGALNVDGLTFPALANSLYQVDIMITGQCSGGSGMQVELACSGAGATGAYYFFGHASSVSVVGSPAAINTLGGGAFWTTAATDLMVTGTGFVKTGANAGNITFQAEKITSGSLTIYQGSQMTVTKRN